jgi:hypothetical protein
MKRAHDVQQLVGAVSHSDATAALTLTRGLCRNGMSARDVLDSLEPLSLFTFSHRYTSIHVPKEHEYLLRLLQDVPELWHVDFLSRFIEYLAWSPKYVDRHVASLPSGVESFTDVTGRYLDAMEKSKGLAALFYANTLAEASGLDEVLRIALRVGCNDLSQDIGHYFSCTDSLVRLAETAGLPQAKDHLFAITMYLMQLSPVVMAQHERPTQTLRDTLSRLVTKGTFVGYHYMIVANGLIKNRAFIGDAHYNHALAQLDTISNQLTSTLSTKAMDALASSEATSGSNDLLTDLQRSIWNAARARAFALLRHYIQEYGVTTELTIAIAHSFTRIDEHPHDPHYVTFPLSAFELLPHLAAEERELILAQCIDFAINRVQQHGLIRL